MNPNELKEAIMNFNNLDEEEQDKVARALIEDSMNEQSISMLIDPSNENRMDFKNIINHLGEEGAVDLVKRILGNATASVGMFNPDEMKVVIEKFKNGTATEDEVRMVKAFMSTFIDENAMNCTKQFMSIMCDFVAFAQNEIEYNPAIFDLLAAINMVAMVSCTHDESNYMSKFKESGPVGVMGVVHNAAQDMLKTWLDSCTTPPDDTVIMLAGIHIAEMMAKKNKYTIAPMDDIAEHLGVTIGEECQCDDCRAERENANGNNETANGSNQTPDMRDLLRELRD